MTKVLWEQSQQLLTDFIANQDGLNFVVTGFIAFYGIYRTNKNTKLVVKYAHKPYIMPIMGKSKKSEEIKSILEKMQNR